MKHKKFPTFLVFIAFLTSILLCSFPLELQNVEEGSVNISGKKEHLIKYQFTEIHAPEAKIHELFFLKIKNNPIVWCWNTLVPFCFGKKIHNGPFNKDCSYHLLKSQLLSSKHHPPT